MVDESDVRDVIPSSLTGYRRVHLFAGIGGWDYALRLANWPEHEPIWTASFPCQPFSAAGRRRGVVDDRHLWPYGSWLIEQCRPRIIVGEQVIAKAKQASFKSGQRIEDHFVDVTEMIDLPKGAQRAIAVTYLSRYACYLIIQNADPTKEVVALGQSYFAVQTRRQELSDQASEDERRLMLREEMKLHNVKLAGAAKDAGVIEPIDYAIFQNHGYQGLYGGLGQKEIHAKKGLKKRTASDHTGAVRERA